MCGCRRAAKFGEKWGISLIREGYIDLDYHRDGSLILELALSTPERNCIGEPERYFISLERMMAPASRGHHAFGRHFWETLSGGLSDLERCARRLEWASR